MTVLPFDAIAGPGDADPTIPIPRVRVAPTTRVVPTAIPEWNTPTWALPTRRRRPAPLLLRGFVWVLSLAFCLAVVGDVAIRVKPGFFPHPAAPAVATATTATSATKATIASAPFRLVAQSGTSSTYALGSSTYEVGVLINQLAWVEITQTSDPSTPVVATVLKPSGAVQWFTVKGESTVSVAARVLDLEVRANGATVGTIPSPSLQHAYVFRPSR